MELEEVMRTTFACRAWTDEPVDQTTVYSLLETARFAPNGGNRQGWHVIVLQDKAIRKKLLPLISPTISVYAAQEAAGEAPWNTINSSLVDKEVASSSDGNFPVLEALLDAPVVLVVTVDLSVVASFDSHLDRVGVISGASIYPFVWNILLAARNAGLGGVLTTYLAGQEPKVQDLLGIPRHHAVAAMVPLGHPTKQLSKLKRLPVEDFTTINTFDGPVFTETVEGQ